MARRAATALHLALSVLGVGLYVLFVIPRWWVLTGDFPGTLAIAGRIAAGIPIAAAAVPVVLNLQRAVKPESATPELALRLRAWSAALHVLAGALILITAIVEIWLPLSSAGPWLFAAYGAAGAIAILAIAAFYLSLATEQPPRPPKPPKPAKAGKEKAGKKKRAKKRKGKGDPADSEATGGDEQTPQAPSETHPGTDDDEVADEAVEAVEAVSEPAGTATDELEPDELKADGSTVEASTAEPAESAAPEAVADAEDTGAPGGLRNKRPTGKVRNRLRR